MPPSSVLREDGIEYGFIGKLQGLKYEYRRDITDRASLEKNFREKFETLNRVRLTDAEFARLLDEIVTPDVFTASKSRTEAPRYSRRVEMAEIEKNAFNLNISRYISTAVGEDEIDLEDTHAKLVGFEKAVQTAAAKHKAFLKELGLPELP